MVMMNKQSNVESALTGKGRYALVIGGSMAGLLAARALSDHFEQVTILERDALPDTPEIRKGVPQANHVHVLLVRGYRLLQKMFPNIDPALDELGAHHFDFANDVAFLVRTGWVPRNPSDMKTRACSRAGLEWCVRDQLKHYPSITIRSGCRVQNLLTTPDKTRVIGVELMQQGQQESQSIHADLVVDASGRSSHSSQWLQDLGYETVEETEINAFVGYATRRYRLPADFQPDWKMLFIFARPPESYRGAALMLEEGNDWVATLVGYGRDYPPTDEEGFLDFAKSLPTPLFYEAIKEGEPLTAGRGHQQTSNRLRHYEKMKQFPQQYIVLGDAVCAFNPIYGQGMTASAMAAELLMEMLGTAFAQDKNSNLAGFSQRFQKRLAKNNEMPWLMATGEDLRYSTTEGAKPGTIDRLVQRYFDQLLLVLPYDPNVGLAFAEVLQLLKPATTLFQVGILARVLRHRLLGHKTAATTENVRMPPPISTVSN
jgi:2-polyprenyl-6-methoxyphenol hydroxylase-like FAD-dependent oxidoreductase